MHAGLAAERIHAKARIVGKRCKPAGAAGMPRLGERVLEETLVRLVGLVDAELDCATTSIGKRREQRRDLADLPGIARSEDETLHGTRYCASQ